MIMVRTPEPAPRQQALILLITHIHLLLELKTVSTVIVFVMVEHTLIQFLLGEIVVVQEETTVEVSYVVYLIEVRMAVIIVHNILVVHIMDWHIVIQELQVELQPIIHTLSHRIRTRLLLRVQVQQSHICQYILMLNI